MPDSPIPSTSNTQTPSSSQDHEPTRSQGERSEKPEKAVHLQIQEINSQVAQFRQLLINVRQPGDCPELREGIRKLRRTCVEACKRTAQQILPHVRRTTEIGIPVDCPILMLLFYVAQLFLRELAKCNKLVRKIPMDMTEYYETRAGPSNIGNVISQILLRKEITPNFHEEELLSIKKDSEDIRGLIAELQEFMPQSAGDMEKYSALQNAGARGHRTNGRRTHRWNQSNERPCRVSSQPSYFRRALNYFLIFFFVCKPPSSAMAI